MNEIIRCESFDNYEGIRFVSVIAREDDAIVLNIGAAQGTHRAELILKYEDPGWIVEQDDMDSERLFLYLKMICGSASYVVGMNGIRIDYPKDGDIGSRLLYFSEPISFDKYIQLPGKVSGFSFHICMFISDTDTCIRFKILREVYFDDQDITSSYLFTEIGNEECDIILLYAHMLESKSSYQLHNNNMVIIYTHDGKRIPLRFREVFRRNKHPCRILFGGICDNMLEVTYDDGYLIFTITKNTGIIIHKINDPIQTNDKSISPLEMYNYISECHFVMSENASVICITSTDIMINYYGDPISVSYTKK